MLVEGGSQHQRPHYSAFLILSSLQCSQVIIGNQIQLMEVTSLIGIQLILRSSLITLGLVICNLMTSQELKYQGTEYEEVGQIWPGN